MAQISFNQNFDFGLCLMIGMLHLFQLYCKLIYIFEIINTLTLLKREVFVTSGWSYVERTLQWSWVERVPLMLLCERESDGSDGHGNEGR